MQAKQFVEAKLRSERKLYAELEEKRSDMVDAFLSGNGSIDASLSKQMGKLKIHIDMLYATYCSHMPDMIKPKPRPRPVVKPRGSDRDVIEEALSYGVRKLCRDYREANLAERAAIRRRGEFDYGEWQYDIHDPEIVDARNAAGNAWYSMREAKDELFSHRRRFNKLGRITYDPSA
jgi:hypothetical protein